MTLYSPATIKRLHVRWSIQDTHTAIMLHVIFAIHSQQELLGIETGIDDIVRARKTRSVTPAEAELSTRLH